MLEQAVDEPNLTEVQEGVNGPPFRLDFRFDLLSSEDELNIFWLYLAGMINVY